MASMIESMKAVKLTRWQIALVVGTPLMIGTSLWVFKILNQKKSPKSEPNRDSPEPSQGSEVAPKAAASVEKVEKKMKSPLEEATVHKNEGNISFKKGKYDEAIQSYDRAILLCPKERTNDLAIFYQNRAAAYEMLKKWKFVKEDCDKSLENNPKYAKAYYRRAKAHEALNNLLDCLYDVTTTCVLEMFQNKTTVFYADRILKQVSRTDAEEAMNYRKPTLPSSHFIQSYFRSYSNEPIMNLQVPESASDSPPKGFVKAKLALDQGKYDDIIEACSEELDNSESADSQYKYQALLLRGTFYLLSGAFTKADRDFTELIENESVPLELRTYALIRRGSLREQCENKEDCFADFDAAELLQPDNADIYQQKAQIYLLLERMDEALTQYEKAVKLAPNHALAHVQRLYTDYRVATLANDSRRLAFIISEFKESLEKFPECSDCYSLLAQVLCEQQQYVESDAHYQKAMSLVPDNPVIYVHRAVLMLQWKGDVEQCESYMNQALEIDDKCELAYETLGTLEVQRGDLDRAVDLFEKAISLAKGIRELTHLCSLRNAAIVQRVVIGKMGINIPNAAALRNISPPRL